MPSLDRQLDSLAAPAPGFPPTLAAALRSTRRKRRLTISGVSAAGALALALAVALMLPSRAGSRPDQLARPDDPDRFTLAALSRANRDADPDRLNLPSISASTPGQAPRHALDARAWALALR